MDLEVLLSVMNYNTDYLNKHNINSNCTVINQCNNNSYKKYKNFKIYNSNGLGHANSCNLGLKKVKSDIILLCDDDVCYEKEYDSLIINEYKKIKNADIIIFNVINDFRKKKLNKRIKRLHIYNILRYASYNISFKRTSIKNIYFNNLFGAGSTHPNGGDDTVFLVDCLKKGLKIYASPIIIGHIISDDSTWFKGYTKKYFYDKGYLYTNISKKFRHLLMLQHLIRHKNILKDISFKEAYKEMLNGSNDYLKVKS